MLPNKKPYQPCGNRLTELLVANITHKLRGRLCSRACLRASQEVPIAGRQLFLPLQAEAVGHHADAAQGHGAPAIMGLSRKPFTG